MRRSLIPLLLGLAAPSFAFAQDVAPEATPPAPVTEPSAPADPVAAPADVVAATPTVDANPVESVDASAATLAAPPVDAAPPVGDAFDDPPVPADVDEPECSCEQDEVAFEGTLGFGLISRALRYTDDVNHYLPQYSLPAGPEFTLDLRWYPGAHFASGVAAAFGVDFRYDRSFGIESEDRGATFGNANRVYEVNALGRYVGDGFSVVGMLGYGNHAFVFEPLTPTTNLVPGYSRVPGVGYQYVRIGAEGRAMLTDHVGVLGGVAYLATFDLGGIGGDQWFPRAKGGGTELKAFALYTLPHHVELRAGLTYRRYFMSMNSEIGDPYVAGGAVDHHTALDLTATYRY